MIERLLRLHDRSAQVADIQARLRALGFVIDDESGYFGPGTRRAVQGFQQQREILIDGIVGPQTWSELVDASWRMGDRNLYLKHPLMRGDDVAALQARLNALGFDAGREDGIFGTQADRAVRAFQKEYGIAEDGIFGARSYAALTGLRVDRPGTAARLREELRHAEQRGISGRLVMIDPGHGGEDLGERGATGLAEADVCWDLALRLADKLGAGGARVRLTRTETDAPTTSERARRANDAGAELFISFHLGHHGEPSADGASTFYFATSRLGEALAEAIQNEICELGMRDCRTHPRRYALLKETRMPAVIVEPGFLSNPEDEKRLDDPDFRGALGEAVCLGIRRYFNEL